MSVDSEKEAKNLEKTQDNIENQEWIDSLEEILERRGSQRVQAILKKLQIHAQKSGINLPYTANTPYINTIPPEKQPKYPGNYEIERTIRSVIRWNAMAMVVHANKMEDGIGGHISTYASAATLFEVA